MNNEDIRKVAKDIGIDVRSFRRYLDPAKTVTPQTRKKVELGLDALKREDLLRPETRALRAVLAFEEESETLGKIPVTAEGAKPVLETWLGRGDRIGVFENADLGHPDCGRKTFIPIGKAEAVEIGKTRAPDSPTTGLGWRYILRSVHDTLDGFSFYGGTSA